MFVTAYLEQDYFKTSPQKTKRRKKPDYRRQDLYTELKITKAVSGITSNKKTMSELMMAERGTNLNRFVCYYALNSIWLGTNFVTTVLIVTGKSIVLL